jgi:hypothetical protein
VAEAVAVIWVSVSDIVVPEDPGRRMVAARVHRYAFALVSGTGVEPVSLRRRDDGRWLLCDGRHRLVAHLLEGVPVLPAVEVA